jgi:O-antigen/teichoic acid export membrane protein
MRDVALTALTSVGAILSLVYVTRVIAQLGPEAFGAYGLSRRLLTVLTSLTTIPLGVALTRSIALADTQAKRRQYFACGLAVALIAGGIALAFAFSFRNVTARIVFHDSAYAWLLVATTALFAAMCVYSPTYSYFRGGGRMDLANAANFVFLSLAPVAAVLLLFHLRSVTLIVFGIAAGTVFAAVPAFAVLRQGRAGDGVWSRFAELREYALPRVPGGLAFSALLAIGPYVASATGALKGAGFLIIGQSLVTITEAGTESFGLVALPKVAGLVAARNSDFLRARIADILTLVVQVGMFATVQLLLWSDQIVYVWLGHSYGQAIPIVRISVLAIVPYLAYSMLRSVIDAVEVRAINTRNVFAAAVSSAIASGLAAVTHAGLLGLAAATVFGMTVLGALSVRFLWRSYRPSGYSSHFISSAAVCLVLGAVGWLAKLALERHMSSVALLASGIVVACCSGAVYLYVLRTIGVAWLGEAEARIFNRS